MSTELNTAVAADLHPDTFLSLDGVDNDTMPFVAPAIESFDAAYKFIGAIHAIREAAFGDPELTPEGALLRTDDCAASKLPGVTRMIDAADDRLKRGIAHLEAELASPVKVLASKAVSSEVRALMQKSGDRVGLMEKALADRDDEVLSAVLGAPPMLSGLTRELHAVFLRKYHEMKNPERSKRLRAMIAARTRLGNQGALVLREMSRAVGTIPVVSQKEGSKGQVIRHVSPAEVRKKRDASAAVYKRHA